MQTVATEKTPNRWLIAGMGTLLQLCLGSVYAWSWFQKPLTEGYGWTNAQVAWTFSFAIGFLGLAAAAGGVALPRFGPRTLAVAGSLLFGAGHLLAALALHLHSLPLLWLGYGVVGGIGLGLGYVTPVATAAKWFPDKKGLVTGMVVMGFGFGALLMSKCIAPLLMAAFDGRLPLVFAGSGAIVGGAGLVAALFMRNPPAVEASAAAAGGNAPAQEPTDWRRFGLMWLVFFCNIAAGIAIIGFQSPLFQALWHEVDGSLDVKTLATYGATLIAVTSLFNGIGRFLWGWLSDKLGRSRTFTIMLGSEILVFAVLAYTMNPWLFAGLFCYILLCYGGSFGAMPAFILDVFGARLMPVVYGSILTAWSAGGIVGPQMVGLISDRWPQQAGHFSFLASTAFVTLGFLATFWLGNQRFEKKRPA